jgi:DNA polymerase-1
MAERPDPSRTLYLIDGSNNLYRAFHALPGLANRKGLPTNAVYGFTTMLRKLMKDFSPRFLAVVFDTPDPTFRHEEFQEYKAHRPDAPEALVVQIPWVKKVLGALRIPTLELPGWEADDLIGTLARRAAAEGMSAVIVATDKDLLQLVGDGILYFNPNREVFLDAAAVEQVFGVRPDQVPDVLALWGDHSDNIPGVPGIGDKGAKDLIRRFGDLETLLAQADRVESRRYREPLLSHAEDARLSRRLAVIRCDAPLEAVPAALQVQPPDIEATRALFTELEFTALLRDLPASQTVLSLDTAVLDDGAVAPLVSRLSGEPAVALTLVREGGQAATAALIGIAAAAADGTAGYLPVAHRGLGAPRPRDPGAAIRSFEPLLAGGAAGPRLLGHDVKPDLMLLRRLGLEPRPCAFDTMLASYLLNPERRSHSLDLVAQEIGGLEIPSWSQALGDGARALPVGDLDAGRAAVIAGTRAAAVARLEAPMRKALEEDGLLGLLEDLELPLAAVLAEMEACGVRIDVPFLRRLSAEWETTLSDLTRRIHALAGREFNINSSRQLGEILFETLKLAPGRRTRKTGSFSTDSEVLEELAAGHELPRLLLEYRALQKLKSTYVDALPALVDPRTGRVHTSLNQAVAATGRLSSSEPNLQNIPIRTEQGRQIRRAFVPQDGWTLLSADYSQIELRVLAHMCGDPVLIEGFRAGEDVHRRTAAALFGVMPPLVTGEMRRRAKAVNFGIIYGMGPQRLARDQGVSHKEAETFIRDYFERFPKVKAYIDATVAAAERDGRVRTLFGRLRYFPDLRGGDRVARMQALRAAVNTTIQGTAADLIKKAMVDLWRRLRREGRRARMLLQVHDELVLEAPADEADVVVAMVREVMEGTHPLDVPLSVDVRRGANWLDLLDEHGRSKD